MRMPWTQVKAVTNMQEQVDRKVEIPRCGFCGQPEETILYQFNVLRGYEPPGQIKFKQEWIHSPDFCGRRVEPPDGYKILSFSSKPKSGDIGANVTNAKWWSPLEKIIDWREPKSLGGYVFARKTK